MTLAESGTPEPQPPQAAVKDPATDPVATRPAATSVGTAPLVEMRDIRVQLAGRFKAATAVGLGQKLAVAVEEDGVVVFTLPRVGEYEVVVLE